MSLSPFSSRPPRHPLGERWKNVIRVIVGVGFIGVGLLFIMTRNIEYPPGDYRGSDAYNVISGVVAILLGAWALLATRYPRLRGPWRKNE